MAAIGLIPDDVEVTVARWPANVESIDYFLMLGDQWRTGAVGVSGMDYSLFFELARRRKIPDDDFERIFDDLRIMVDEAMKTMQDSRSTA